MSRDEAAQLSDGGGQIIDGHVNHVAGDEHQVRVQVVDVIDDVVERLVGGEPAQVDVADMGDGKSGELGRERGDREGHATDAESALLEQPADGAAAQQDGRRDDQGGGQKSAARD